MMSGVKATHCYCDPPEQGSALDLAAQAKGQTQGKQTETDPE